VVTRSRNYNLGLSHQITAPWAADNDTVAQVRSRVRDSFFLYATDKARVYKAGTNTVLTPDFNTESTTHLAKGDHLMFYRRDDVLNRDMPYGIMISAISSIPSTIMSEQIVQNDR